MRAAALLLCLAALPAAAEATKGASPGVASGATKTFIKGRRMEVLKKGEVTSFSGGVTMTRGTDFMSADRMLAREKEGLTQAWGNVYLKRRDPSRGLLWEAWGDEGAYDTETSSGSLAGAVYVEVHESAPAERVTRLWARSILHDAAAGTVVFLGAYPADGPRRRDLPPAAPGAAPGPRALQRGEDGLMRQLRGSKLTLFEADARLQAEGDVGVFWEGGALWRGGNDVPAR